MNIEIIGQLQYIESLLTAIGFGLIGANLLLIGLTLRK